jgi:hypothetical protein
MFNKPAINDAGAYCLRLDKMIFVENMLERVYNEINKADFIIADLSTKNANVFYELGYAHALSKKVILITDNSDDIPFDLQQYQYLTYNRNDLAKLKEEINERILYYMTEPYQPEYRIVPYQMRINDKDLIKDETYKVYHYVGRSSNAFEIEIEVINSDMTYHEIGNNKVYILIEESILENEYRTKKVLQGSKLVFQMNKVPSLFPLERGILSASIVYDGHDSMHNYYNKIYGAEINIHFPFNVIKIPFKFELLYR